MKNPLPGFVYFLFFYCYLINPSYSENSLNSDDSSKKNYLTIVEDIIDITHEFQSITVSQGTIDFLANYISTSGGPTDVYLNALSNNNTTSWLYVNDQLLNNLRFTSGSEISFEVRATNLSPGNYVSIITVSASGYESAQMQINLEVTGISVLNTSIKINFQDEASIPPSGWLKDFGQAFGPRTSSPNDYGWRKRADGSLLDLSTGGTAGNGRNRNTPDNILLATFMHMQGGDINNFNGNTNEGMWEIAVPNDNYLVEISVGDETETDSEHSINVEGVNAISKFIPTTTNRFSKAEATVHVSDGFLTIDAIGGKNTKINSVQIESLSEIRPAVVSTNPANNSENVETNTSISTALLNLPNGGIDNTSLSSSSVFLEELPSEAKVPANVNGTGGGDVITLVPANPLKPNTEYKFTITEEVKDVTGASFIPYSMKFTTGSSTVGEIPEIQFVKIKQAASDQVKHTTLVIGPDEKLYAATLDGRIRRYPIADDGTLGTPEIFVLKDLYGNNDERIIIGLVFDPAATAENPIIYITHTQFKLEKADNFASKITRLNGPNLENLEDIVINLPRSTKDHLTNSIVFGPDGALYFCQGSNTAMGEADKTWDMRPENLLSATVLRLDLSKIGSLPLNVLTPESGGSYNPYAADAPLTIYSSGLRNAFDLIWHSNGQLYVPTNGSGAGGNSPASVNGVLRPDGTTYNGPSVPSLNSIKQVLPDFLFRVEKGGYYGHPNPLRGEFVLFGGNPTAGNDPAQIVAYPVGTLPDTNWKGFAYDFGLNKSANGIIEYKSETFNGALKGKLMVARFSQNKDIITLTPGGPNLDITGSIEGLAIPGFSGFIDPLDLIEDTRNGNIYVSEFARNENEKGNITLLKPVEKSNIASSVKELIFSSVKNGVTSAKIIPVKNNGSNNVSITNLSFEGNDNNAFEIQNIPTLPLTLEANETINLEVVFKPSGTVGSLESFLNIYANDNSIADLSIGVYGLSANGLEGSNEPPLNNIVKTLGYDIDVGGTGLELNTSPEHIGDEIYAPLFQKAGAGNIEIIPVARYSPLEELPFGFYAKENGSIQMNQVGILSGESPQHQALFPQMASGNNFFNPSSKSFGLYTNSTNGTHITYSEVDLNPGNGPNNELKHLVRVYPLKDRQGNPINNSYLVGFEEATNGDYQDYVFVIRNVRPAPALPPTLSAIPNPAAIPMGSGKQDIDLVGISAGEGESQTISITATSSNPSLIPNPAIQYQSSSNSGTLSYTPVANKSGVSDITVTVTDSGPNTGIHKNSLTRTFSVIVNGPDNNAPTLDPITDPDPIDQDAPAQVIDIAGISAGEGEEDQTISVSTTSDNPELIPEPIVNYTSPNPTGTLTYTPKPGAYGFATITVTVEDDGISDEFNTNTFSQSFTVEVKQVNVAPTISEIPFQYINVNEVMEPVSFTIADVDTNVDDLELEATSDNQDLVSDSNITFGGAGPDRTVTITPNADESGEALITIYVSDGFSQVESSFKLFVGNPTSIDVENLKDRIILFPNPAYTEVEIRMDHSRIGDVSIEVFDISGKVHHKTTIFKQEDPMTLNLNVEKLPKGVYIIRINQNGLLISRKLIKL